MEAKLLSFTEECNTKYNRLSTDTTPTFCVYYFINDIKNIKINLQNSQQ